MQASELIEVIEAHRQGGEPYHEFIRESTLSVGLYVLKAGSTDPQQPHTEEEVYYVVQGRGMITVGGEERPVKAGSIVFVGEMVEHRFHSITEDLQVIVIFAPPRRSRAANN